MSAPTPGPWFVEADGVYNETRSYMIFPIGDSEQDRVDAAHICALKTERDELRVELDAALLAYRRVWEAMIPPTVTD